MSMMNYKDSNCNISSFLSYENEFRQQKSGFDQGNFKDDTDKPCMLCWKSGKLVDPRLIKLLETFKGLYGEQLELFKKIFPQLQDEFVDVFKKIGAASSEKDHKKAETLQRSLSVGSPRIGRGIDVSEPRLDRFKVRTPDVGGVISAGQGGQNSQGDQAKPTGSK